MRRWALLSLFVSLTFSQATPAFAAAARPAAAEAKGQGAAKKPRAARGPKKITYADVGKYMGQGVWVGTASSMPPNVLTMMRRAALQRDGRTNVFYMSTFAPKANFEANVTDKWHPNLIFVSGSNREAASNAHKGQATLRRGSLFDHAQKLAKDEYPIDTVIVRVSPPDKDGMVSLGTNNDLTLPALQSVLRRGGKIIAEVNPNVPHAQGNRIPYKSIAAVIENNDLLGEHQAILPNPLEMRIAKNIAKLVPNKRTSTIQIGIGNALNGLGETLKGKKIALWSEMGGEWLVPLMTAEQGNKPALTKGTVSFLLGTGKLHDVLRNNEGLEVRSTTEVNDPEVIAQKTRMRAINTALQVDLTGNVNAEQIGNRIISAPGGQPDFMKGASMSPKGKAILALRSIHDGTQASSIVLGLEGPTTTPKSNVDHVVTEWGTTRQLRGMSDGARAYEIISIAHPLHRVGLAEVALKRGLINQAKYDKLGRSVFHSIRLADATERRELAAKALEKGLVTQAQHEDLVKDLPAAAGPVVAAQ